PVHIADAWMHRINTVNGSVTIRWNLFANYGQPGYGDAVAWGNDYAATGNDFATGVTLSADRDVFVTGYTTSTAIMLAPAGPPGPTPFQTAKSGGSDNFIVQFDGPDVDPVDDQYMVLGGQYDYEYSTYVGGPGNDRAFAIAVDADENAYI